jgi:hypothetical protein
MNGETLKELAESILDGQTLDQDFFLQLANIAKNKLEGERLWQYLKKLDDTQSASSGNNYNSAKTLPTDFALDYLVEVGTGFVEQTPVRFEEQHKYRQSANRYYIDLANNSFYILGPSNGGTIYFFYKRTTPDITMVSEPVFPERFHPILAYMVAGYYQAGVDSDDIYARMSPENKTAALEIKASMIQWDTDLALRAQDGQIGVAGSAPGIDLSQM